MKSDVSYEHAASVFGTVAVGSGVRYLKKVTRTLVPNENGERKKLDLGQEKEMDNLVLFL